MPSPKPNDWTITFHNQRHKVLSMRMTITFLLHIFNANNFIPILDRKNTENTQICHTILQISLDYVFMCFRYKWIEKRWKTSKVCRIGRISPPTFRKCQNWSLEIYFWRKVNNIPPGIKKWHLWSLEYNFQHLAKLTLELSKLAISVPVFSNLANKHFKSLWNYNLERMVPWMNFGDLA